jgi:hypothetical protein
VLGTSSQLLPLLLPSVASSPRWQDDVFRHLLLLLPISAYLERLPQGLVRHAAEWSTYIRTGSKDTGQVLRCTTSVGRSSPLPPVPIVVGEVLER